MPVDKINIQQQIDAAFRKFNLNSKGIDSFIDKHCLKLDFLDEVGLGAFICNYQSSDYYYLSDDFLNIVGFSRKVMMKGGINALYNLMPDEDTQRVLFLMEYAIKFIYELPELQKHKVQVTVFYRLKSSSNEMQWIMQTSRFFYTEENAWVELGFINRLAHTESLDTYPPHCQINFGKQRKFIFPPSSGKVLGMKALSDRELEVLYWSRLGYLVKEIADKLNITEAGIRFHRRNILKKLGKRNFIGLELKRKN